MKTHEIAKILSSLAQALRATPNVELNQLALGIPARLAPDPASIPIALSALVSLAKFDKTQWRAVIAEYGMPIDVKPTESTRDIVGKVLRHLEQDPESRTSLKQAVHRTRSDISPELMNALNFLLK